MPGQPEMLETLEAAALSSPRAYSRESFDRAEWTRAERWNEYEHVTVGEHTVSDLKAHHKLVDHSQFPVPNNELARTYLKVMMERYAPRRRMIPYNKETGQLLRSRVPLYFAGHYEGHVTYLDISSAYYQLFGPAALDMRFNPWRGYVSGGRISFDQREFLEDSSHIRHALGGIISTSSVSGYHHGEHYGPVPKFNQYLAPELFGYIIFSLHYMAHEAIRLLGPDLLYWNNDGAIVPTGRVEELRRYLRVAWGVETKVKGSGPGHVSALGSYACGEYRTRKTSQTEPRTEKLYTYVPALAARMKEYRGIA